MVKEVLLNLVVATIAFGVLMFVLSIAYHYAKAILGFVFEEILRVVEKHKVATLVFLLGVLVFLINFF